MTWLRRTHPAKSVVLAVNKCESSVKADLQVGNTIDILAHLACAADASTGITL